MKKILKLLSLISLSIITALAFAACELNKSSSEDVTDEAGKTAFTNLITYMSSDTAVAPDSYSISYEMNNYEMNSENILTKTSGFTAAAAIIKTGTYYEAMTDMALSSYTNGAETSMVYNTYYNQINGQYYTYVKGPDLFSGQIKRTKSKIDVSEISASFNIFSFISSLAKSKGNFDIDTETDFFADFAADDYSFTKTDDVYTLTISATVAASEFDEEATDGTVTVNGTLVFTETAINSIAITAINKDTTDKITGKTEFSLTISNIATITPPADIDEYLSTDNDY